MTSTTPERTLRSKFEELIAKNEMNGIFIKIRAWLDQEDAGTICVDARLSESRGQLVRDIDSAFDTLWDATVLKRATLAAITGYFARENIAALASSEATEAGKPDFHENRLTKADLRQMLKREVAKRREEAGKLEELRAKVETRAYLAARAIPFSEPELTSLKWVLAEIDARLAGTPRKGERKE